MKRGSKPNRLIRRDVDYTFTYSTHGFVFSHHGVCVMAFTRPSLGAICFCRDLSSINLADLISSFEQIVLNAKDSIFPDYYDQSRTAGINFSW